MNRFIPNNRHFWQATCIIGIITVSGVLVFYRSARSLEGVKVSICYDLDARIQRNPSTKHMLE